MNCKKVLLTGSRGFTGPYLQQALIAAGYDVHDSHTNLLDITALRQAVLMIKPDYVIHLASISNPIHDNIDALYQVNLHGTLNLLAALRESTSINPIKKILLASTAYVYGTPSIPMTETTCPKPITHYAMSKLSMEYMASSLFSDLPLVIARPFNYTGVHQPLNLLIPKIIHHFKTKAPVIQLGNLHVYREFNDVRMVAETYCQLLTHADAGTTINICTGQHYSLQDILALCTKISGHSLDVTVNPDFVRRNDAPVLTGDPTKLQQLLPHLPIYTLEDTLRWMIE